MTVRDMNFWLVKFVLKICRRDGEPYSPETLYQICCRLLRLLKEADKAEVNMLSNPMFCHFHAVLDSQMKELKATGKYQARKADHEVITKAQEELLFVSEGVIVR